MEWVLLIVGIGLLTLAGTLGPNPSKARGLTGRELQAIGIGLGLVFASPLIARLAGQEHFLALTVLAAFGPVFVATVAGRRFWGYVAAFAVLGIEFWGLYRLYHSPRAGADWQSFWILHWFALPAVAIAAALISLLVYLVWDVMAGFATNAKAMRAQGNLLRPFSAETLPPGVTAASATETEDMPTFGVRR